MKLYILEKPEPQAWKVIVLVPREKRKAAFNNKYKKCKAFYKHLNYHLLETGRGRPISSIKSHQCYSWPVTFRTTRHRSEVDALPDWAKISAGSQLHRANSNDSVFTLRRCRNYSIMHTSVGVFADASGSDDLGVSRFVLILARVCWAATSARPTGLHSFPRCHGPVPRDTRP